MTPQNLIALKFLPGKVTFFYKPQTNIILTLHKDKKLVYMLSTNSPNTVEISGKPIVVKTVNKYIRGVDFNGQLCLY